jgi:hypothetical protein
MEDDYQIESRQLWETLKSLPVALGKRLSEPPPLFMRGDRNVIVQIDIPKMTF